MDGSGSVLAGEVRGSGQHRPGNPASQPGRDSGIQIRLIETLPPEDCGGRPPKPPPSRARTHTHTCTGSRRPSLLGSRWLALRRPQPTTGAGYRRQGKGISEFVNFGFLFCPSELPVVVFGLLGQLQPRPLHLWVVGGQLTLRSVSWEAVQKAL